VRPNTTSARCQISERRIDKGPTQAEVTRHHPPLARWSGELGMSWRRLRVVNSGHLRAVAAAGVLTAFALVACGEEPIRRTRSARGVKGTKTTPGQWNRIPRAPAGWYRPEGAFWIDGRLIVVAASTIEAWDPQRNKWQVLVRIPQAEECEGGGYSEATVWTGKEILLWGGGFSYEGRGDTYDGAAFDSRTHRLRALPHAPIASRWWHTAVWTGEEMVVWGGSCGRHECEDGAAYNPTTDSWRRIADAPMPGYAHSAVWTGKEMVVWGGSDDMEAEGRVGFPRTFLNAGAAYDPSEDSWRVLESSNLSPRGWHITVWTGEEMIVWGGVRAPCDAVPCDTLAVDAGAYNPESRTWRSIPHGPLSGRVEPSAVWNGEEMIVWGGASPGGGLAYDDGATYDPVTNEWELIADAPIARRSRHIALWTGDGMIVWGGQPSNGGSFSDGAEFRPVK
jgi:hypothetical protein